MTIWGCSVAVGSAGGQVHSTVCSPDPLAPKKESLRTPEKEGEERRSWGLCSYTNPSTDLLLFPHVLPFMRTHQ